MKKLIVSTLFSLALFLSSVALSQEFETAKSTGICIDSKNFVFLQPSDESEKVIKKDVVIIFKDAVQIRTQWEAFAEIYMSSGIRIHLLERSSIWVDVAEQDVVKIDEKTLLEHEDIGRVFLAKIDSGTVFFQLNKIPNEISNFSIDTDYGMVIVDSSTNFSVEITKFKFARVQSYSGKLKIISYEGKEIEVGEGQEALIFGEEFYGIVKVTKIERTHDFKWAAKKLPDVRLNNGQFEFKN